ncbi:MAG: hypothetical protein ACRCWF_08545 [Beijerinckiaceae bacterium]
MAYGAPLSDRDFESDPRDVVEEAARAAGMSVSEWLNRAGSGYEQRGPRMTRQHRRRYQSDYGDDHDYRAPRTRYGMRDNGYSEDRIERILNGAMDNIEDSLRSTEERTASALQALSRRLNEMERAEERSANRSHPETADSSHVQSAIADIQNTLGRLNVRGAATKQATHPSDNSDLVRKLETKISNVVNLLESKSAQRSQQPQPSHLSQEAIAHAVRQELRQELHQSGLSSNNTTQTERLASVENALRLLASKMDTVPLRQENSQSSEITSALEDMNNVVRSLKNNGQQAELLNSIRQLEQRLGNHDMAPGQSRDAVTESLTRIHEELNRLQQKSQTSEASLHASSGLSAIEKQMGSISERIDALTEKLATARLSGPRDLRLQKPVNTAFDELKALILKSHAPTTDPRVLNSLQTLERKVEKLEREPGDLVARLDRIQSMVGEQRSANTVVDELKSLLQKNHAPNTDTRVLDSLQTLERKVETMERGPAELVARLDRIQSMVGEKPVQAMPKNLEPLLQNIVSRLEQVQSQPVDDKSFDKLHEEIRQLSKKLESAPANLQIPAAADISGVERHLSDLFRQMEAWKTDLGEVTQRAASKAAVDAVSKNVFAPATTSSDSSHVEKALSDLQTSQQEGERRTNETLEAVHSTLQRVVDRLVDMERDIQAPKAAVQQPPVVRTAAQQPQVMHAPVTQHPMIDASVSNHLMQQESYAAPVSRARPLEEYPAAMTPPQQSTVPVFDPSILPEAINAADQGFGKTLNEMRPAKPLPSVETVLDAARPTVDVAPAKTGLAAALEAARNVVTGRKKDKATVNDSDLVPPLDAAVSGQPAKATDKSILDLPLEPGTGRPSPAQSARAVAMAAAAAAPITATPADPKAAFLAAARRAAQAAADQSAEVLSGSQKKASSAKELPGAATAAATGAKAGLTKKHAILLGLAALIVAVGATMQFMGGSTRKAPPAKELTNKEAPERTSSLLPAPRSSVATTPAQPARQILPSANTDALPPPLQTSPQVSQSQTAQVKEALAKETLARNDERIAPTPPRAASPSAAFGLPDPASVGSINPAQKTLDTAKTQASAALPPASSVKPVASDPLFKFEGVRGAEKLKQAARAGDPNAFLELGNRFADGRGATRDPKTAALWYERAAEFGSAPAQYRLASMYREGRGLERNPKVALKHFQTAAEAGNARAMHNTAVLLAEGVNGSPDYAGAADWFKKAAEFGIKDSQFNLAILYARGLGTSQDLMASYAWFAAAGGQGDEDAIKKRDEVGSRLSPERLEQAKSAAASWKARTPDPSANEVIVPAGGWDDQAKVVPPEAKAKAPRG